MMATNKITFHLTNNKTAECFSAKPSDLEHLVSQFNNGHLMRISNIYINPRELVAFIIEETEEAK
nr:MAG TPA: hypothetical protein [Caudoviricetes sp.]